MDVETYTIIGEVGILIILTLYLHWLHLIDVNKSYLHRCYTSILYCNAPIRSLGDY